MYKTNVVMSWRRIMKGNAIIGSKCHKCRALLFPIKRRCDKCSSHELENYRFSGKGKVYSHSTIYHPSEGFEKQVPYSVAIIELDEGPKITAQIVDFDEIHTGMKVESCLRKIHTDGDEGIIEYGIKFRPVE